MIHAVSVYLLHPLVGRGYQFWSGVGSDLMYVGAFAAVWRHVNCEQPRCLRPGHRHPGHGRPVCRKHYKNEMRP